jgi:hypothetical protein
MRRRFRRCDDYPTIPYGSIRRDCTICDALLRTLSCPFLCKFLLRNHCLMMGDNVDDDVVCFDNVSALCANVTASWNSSGWDRYCRKLRKFPCVLSPLKTWRRLWHWYGRFTFTLRWYLYLRAFVHLLLLFRYVPLCYAYLSIPLSLRRISTVRCEVLPFCISGLEITLVRTRRTVREKAPNLLIWLGILRRSCRPCFGF